MNYGAIKLNDIANGEGVRVSLFVSGCERHCKDCFNPETWSFDYGKPFTYETLNYLLDALDRPYIQGLSILGGEPLNEQNAQTVELILRVMRLRFGDTKDVWIYTGNKIEFQYTDTAFNNTPWWLQWTTWVGLADVIVDGEFDVSKKDPSLWYKGSSNQRVIDMHKSFPEIVEWKPRYSKFHSQEIK